MNRNEEKHKKILKKGRKKGKKVRGELLKANTP